MPTEYKMVGKSLNELPVSVTTRQLAENIYSPETGRKTFDNATYC